MAVRASVSSMTISPPLGSGTRRWKSCSIWRVHLDAGTGARRHFADEILDQFEVLGVVHEDTVDFLGQEVANGTFDEAGLLVEQDGATVRGVDLLDDGLPALEQHVQVADEPAGLLALAGGACPSGVRARTGPRSYGRRRTRR
ncbi:MAG: hypothetical protein RI910_2205 [Verrucomicrobiota bacterium]